MVFITCLIWVWADLSLDKNLTGQRVTITASQANPNLWVSLENKPEVQVEVDLKGPTAKISEFSKKVESEEGLRLSFDVDREGMSLEGSYTLNNLRRFLYDELKEYGLAVVGSNPEKLEVQVVGLSEKSLPVKCVDEQSGAVISNAQISPDTVNIRAPAGVDAALVRLSLSEKKRARQSSVEKKPFVEVGGRPRYAEKIITVKLPLTGQDLQTYTVRGTVGFIVSANWTGQYKVEWIKAPDTGSISILATPEAKAAYEAQLFEVLLEIKDADINAGEVTRKVIYNFPAEFVHDEKIRLNGDPAEAVFRLVPVVPSEPGLSP